MEYIFLKKKKTILAALGMCCSMQALCSVARGLSLVATGSRAHRFSCCSTARSLVTAQAYLHAES